MAEDTRRSFDLQSWQGLTELLKRARESSLSPAEYAAFRNLVLQYSQQKGSDASLKQAIESYIARFDTPRATGAGGDASSVSHQNEVSQNGAGQAHKGHAGRRAVPTFKKSHDAPRADVRPPERTVPSAPKVVLPPPPPTPPAREESLPVPPQSPIPEPPRTPPPAASPVPFRTVEEHRTRIMEIKRRVNSLVGNPISLMDHGNSIGREYMAALLTALKATSPGTTLNPETSMAALEASYAKIVAHVSGESGEAPVPDATPALRSHTEPAPLPSAPPAYTTGRDTPTHTDDTSAHAVAEEHREGELRAAKDAQARTEAALAETQRMMREEITALREELTAREETLAHLRDEGDRSDAVQAEATIQLKDEIDDLRRGLLEREAALADAKAEQAAIGAELVRTHEQVNDEIAALREELREHERELERELESEEGVRAELVASNRAMQEEIARLRASLEAREEEVTEAAEVRKLRPLSDVRSHVPDTAGAESPAPRSVVQERINALRRELRERSEEHAHHSAPHHAEAAGSTVRTGDVVTGRASGTPNPAWDMVTDEREPYRDDVDLRSLTHRPDSNMTGVTLGTPQSELMSPDVTMALIELLHEWNIFAASGLFGMGPGGIDHPLYLRLAKLPMGEVVMGRFEHANQRIVRSIKDYVDAWRHEQGVAYNPTETFEHYLRRVAQRIMKRRQTGE